MLSSIPFFQKEQRKKEKREYLKKRSVNDVNANNWTTNYSDVDSNIYIYRNKMLLFFFVFGHCKCNSSHIIALNEYPQYKTNI
jgi:hypothetical protein